MTRIAAVGDLHVGSDSRGRLRHGFERLAERSDLLLLAGDLTRCGDPSEVDILVDELGDVAVPVVAVLGNHDHHAGLPHVVARRLERAGIEVLEGTSASVTTPHGTVGIAGVKGFGGGFDGACATAFGEACMKAFVGESRHAAETLASALSELDTDHRVALLHYSPTPDTLQGEPLQIYPFLGSSLLAEAVDDVGADLVLHGHAHRGSEKGTTPGGVRVRNVALPVLRRAYAVFDLRGLRSAA
jgi:Icc-related predicted phosphoesterase